MWRFCSWPSSGGSDANWLPLRSQGVQLGQLEKKWGQGFPEVGTQVKGVEVLQLAQFGGQNLQPPVENSGSRCGGSVVGPVQGGGPSTS